MYLPITLIVRTIVVAKPSCKVRISALASRRTFQTTVPLCWLFCATVVVCQAPDPSKPISQYVHNSWSSQDGLPSNAINGVLQTPDGYLWVATQEGLARFNGAEFTIFDKSNMEAMSGNELTMSYSIAEPVLTIKGKRYLCCRMRLKRLASTTLLGQKPQIAKLAVNAQ